MTAYLLDKLVLDSERACVRPLYYNQFTIWRLDWVVRQYWIQVLAVELKKMAQDWGVRITWSTTNTQVDTGRCLVSIGFHWALPFSASDAVDEALTRADSALVL